MISAVQYENKITDMVKESYPSIMVQLYSCTLVHYNPLGVLEENNGTVTLQRGVRWYGWFDTDEKICTNALITFLNVGNGTLYTKVNAIDIIATSVLEITFNN